MIELTKDNLDKMLKEAWVLGFRAAGMIIKEDSDRELIEMTANLFNECDYHELQTKGKIQ